MITSWEVQAFPAYCIPTSFAFALVAAFFGIRGSEWEQFLFWVGTNSATWLRPSEFPLPIANVILSYSLICSMLNFLSTRVKQVSVISLLLNSSELIACDVARTARAWACFKKAAYFSSIENVKPSVWLNKDSIGSRMAAKYPVVFNESWSFSVLDVGFSWRTANIIV